ncbi:MAG TPA: aminotransferase class I/II-fold pyridoxal phosphate-dependent enzyme, partial [Bdellovibrionota bacterium]|nr:aminotransferase class I/II-fold pyridoxal phosphate-dependent enzyme [Bdellovibrionota bacterium]
SGGYVAGRKELVSWLRQKSRSYLFSGAPPPASVASALKGFELLEEGAPEIEKLRKSTEWMRKALEAHKQQIVPSNHPIISVVVGSALAAQKMVNRLFREGVFVLGYSYPVVPRDSARIRFQLTAAHTRKDLEAALTAIQ